MPNISVSAVNQDNGFGKTVVMGEDGNFVFVLMPPGVCRVEAAAAQDFGVAKYENITVAVGARNTLEIALAVGASVNVVVNAEGFYFISPRAFSINLSK